MRGIDMGGIDRPLLFAMIGYGYMFSFREALSRATTEGSRAAVGTVSTTGAASAAQGAVARSLAQYGLRCQAGDLRDTGGRDVGDCLATLGPQGCAFDAGLVSVSVGAPPTTPPCEITVRVTHSYREHSLLPTVPLLDVTLPERLGFTSVVTVG